MTTHDCNTHCNTHCNTWLQHTLQHTTSHSVHIHTAVTWTLMCAAWLVYMWGDNTWLQHTLQHMIATHTATHTATHDCNTHYNTWPLTVFIFIRLWHELSRVRHDSFICDMTRSYECSVTHYYVWHDSFMSVGLYECDMTRSCVWHESCRICARRTTLLFVMLSRYYRIRVCVTWLVYECDMTHSCGVTHSWVWHDSFVSVAWLVHECGSMTWLIHVCDIACSCGYDEEAPLNDRSLLRKSPVKETTFCKKDL